MFAKMYIYRNLNSGTDFSIKLRGKVIDRQSNFSARNVELRVSAAGNKRAKLTKVRNVHAFVVTNAYNINAQQKPETARRISYNPFKSSAFVWEDTNAPVQFVDTVWFTNGKMYGE
jgi:hypothetical protein